MFGLPRCFFFHNWSKWVRKCAMVHKWRGGEWIRNKDGSRSEFRQPYIERVCLDCGVIEQRELDKMGQQE